MALFASFLRSTHHATCGKALVRLCSISSTSANDRHILLEHIHKKDDHDDGTRDTTTNTASIPSSPFISMLTLNRPKANAMGNQMLQELSDAIETLETSDSRCLVVTSHSHRVFSAGADLKERSTMTLPEAQEFVTRLRKIFQQFSRLPMPSIAAMEGVAVGGGLELALACDLRVASTQAIMGLPETSLAIIPGAGGTQRLTRLIGMARAKQLILTGERIDGIIAKDYGLVQYVVEPVQCLDKAMEIAWTIAANGPVAIRAAKQAMIDGIHAASMEEALEIERLSYALTLPTEDRLEGLAAFKEGRTPDYKGR